MSEEPITFKRIKKKPRRQPLSIDDDDEDNLEEVSSKLSEMRELQELRKKPHGVSVIGLALGKKVTVEEEVIHKDPFKIQTGGLLNMNTLKSGKIKQVDDAYDTGIGTQFSVETNKRDEDEEMMKFIEEKLNKSKKPTEQIKENTQNTNKYTTPEEAALQAVPTHLRESTAKKSEEMLSNQMLCGIPEIDLGIEAKIKNIEATEEAKLRLLRENQNKNDGPSQFVPTNIAVNFVQHNKSNAEQKTALIKPRKEKPQTDEPDSKKPKKEEKATDDYHFERFKKQFRRH
ncbi:telomere length and silencing protein 1 homolog isoform X2 [Coccinella septempunctata]|uniref:telomere length and silencing protein 1 homolog isoform X2 n=2 Tax=Coccinella septempunctata TaxID=41139 RepID=UPI001D081E8E|nr:telomere length and silencing protein 1 homolog isoform X2 [Coccinella septempunctata]